MMYTILLPIKCKRALRAPRAATVLDLLLALRKNKKWYRTSTVLPTIKKVVSRFVWNWKWPQLPADFDCSYSMPV